MGTENEVQWGNLEVYMEDARRRRSEAVGGMIANLLTRLTGVFGNLAASPVQTMGPALPITGKAHHQGSAV
ncbi:MAG: hypothetical protein ACOYOS_01455 [Syntrophales bacterium]